MRTTRARLEGRVGGGVWQPWRDLRKLLAKEPTRAPGSTPVLTLAPIVLMASSLVLCALIPLVSTLALASVPGDLFVVVSVLLIGTVALALLGLESGTAFGGMGSSRHMVIAALVEPTVLLSIYALSVPAGTSALAAIVQARRADPASLLNPVSLLAIFALRRGRHRGDRTAARRQPVHPPRADHDPRGDDPGERRPRPRLAGTRLLAAPHRPARPRGQPRPAVRHRAGRCRW